MKVIVGVVAIVVVLASAIGILLSGGSVRKGVESPEDAINGLWLRDRSDSPQKIPVEQIQWLNDSARREALKTGNYLTADEFVRVDKFWWSKDFVPLGQLQPITKHCLGIEILQADAAKRSLRIKQPWQSGPDAESGSPPYGLEDRKQFDEREYYVSFNRDFTRMTLSILGDTAEQHYLFVNP